MEEKLTGIVLGGVAYGESDKILSIYTLEKGTISAKIKGVKKAGAKLKFASEPFCFAEFMFSSKGDKRTVIGASLLESFYSLRVDIAKYYAGATVLEFTKRFYKESMVDKDYFFLVIESLKELAFTEKTVEEILVRFLLSALKKMGYALNLEGCANCGGEIDRRTYFDYNNGGFYCEDCFGGIGREINRDTFIQLQKIAKGNEVEERPIKALRLIEYYIKNKAEENLSSLQELLKILV